MKNFTRIITLVLALLMVSAMVIACANNTNDDPATTTTPGAENPTGTTNPGEDTQPSNVDANGYLKDNLPADLNYGNSEVMVLHWNAERDEFFSEGVSGDNILDAIWNRNLAIEERLGVKLGFEECDGNNANLSVFVKKVENSYSASEKVYDIIATYSRTAAQLAIRGYYADLNSIEDSYIDKEMPWWPEAITETMGVGDALYYVSGDASTNTLHFMYTIYYNKNLLTDLNLQDPTELVDNHQWTIEKLIEMSSNQYQDLDSDTKLSGDDFYGFTTIYYGVDAFYTGSNLKLVERTDDDELLKISDDYFSAKAVDLVDKLKPWLTSNDCYVSRKGAAVSFAVPFVNGNALFCQNRVYLADSKHSSGLNNVEWKYGLVPTPLYDENQENYITVIGNPFTLYGVMVDCNEKTQMSAVLECWGSEAYRLTTPALFETNMKYKYSTLDASARMFDILRETSSFDQGRIYSNTLGPYMSEIISSTACDGGSWATVAKVYQRQLPKQLQTITKAFQNIQSQK